jgi:hypothetical protein
MSGDGVGVVLKGMTLPGQMDAIDPSSDGAENLERLGGWPDLKHRSLGSETRLETKNRVTRRTEFRGFLLSFLRDR